MDKVQDLVRAKNNIILTTNSNSNSNLFVHIPCEVFQVQCMQYDNEIQPTPIYQPPFYILAIRSVNFNSITKHYRCRYVQKRLLTLGFVFSIFAAVCVLGSSRVGNLLKLS